MSQPKVRILHSIYFNFKTLPFSQAIRLPILFYGPINIYMILGRVKIICDDLYCGMIKIGKNNEFFNGVDNNSFISLGEDSLVVFNGPCAISNNYVIRVSRNAKLSFGAYTFFGSNVRFICTTEIDIGKYTRCAYGSQIVDSNFHYVMDMKKKNVCRHFGKIVIGDYNWIGNHTSITKDCVTKPYTIVCSNTLLCKDYSVDSREHVMIGGIPGKIIKDSLSRIYSTDYEKLLNDFFNQNPNINNYVFDNCFKDNTDSIDKWFKTVM